MTGLELARGYWHEIGKPAFSTHPEILENAAVGLVGEGSDCYGFDDDVSRDHDWGPGFCLWLTDEAFKRCGSPAEEIYASLSPEYCGCRRLNVIPETANRVGIHTVSGFYSRFTSLKRPPETVNEWRGIPEAALSAATNGEVFFDNAGEFTSFRNALLAYYPEPLRLKKLSAACALAAQSGQYNYARCMRHGEPVAALQALGEFISHAQHAIFILNRRYAPYYKWTHRALRSLPILGSETAPLFRALTDSFCDREAVIEQISALLIEELRREGLSASSSDFLLQHAEETRLRIADPFLQSIPLMAE